MMALSRSIVGLEIDTGSARAVELSGKVDSPGLRNMAAIALPEDSVKEGIVLQPQQVGFALKELWSRAGFKERNILLGVSNQGVLVRHITVPKVSPDKLKNVITFQAEEHLPIPLNSVVLDYLVLGEIEAGEGKSAELEVLLVAARRDMLNNYLEALALADLEPIDIDVSSMTMIRLLPSKAMSMTVVMVNVANGLNSILVSAQGKPRMARLGMVKISDLAESLNCSLKDIFNIQILNKPDSKEIIIAWAKNLAVEIRSSVTYYQDQQGVSPVEGVLLSGRGALLKGLDVNLEKQLDLPVRTFNPIEVYSPANRRFVKSDFDAIEYAISMGLAIRGLEG